jgi:hypothetical protein
MEANGSVQFSNGSVSMKACSSPEFNNTNNQQLITIPEEQFMLSLLITTVNKYFPDVLYQGS